MTDPGAAPAVELLFEQAERIRPDEGALSHGY
jgi:hypothetical protein